MKTILSISTLILSGLLATAAVAADDPTIPKDTRVMAQAAMKSHIEKGLQANNGKFPIKDKKTGKEFLLDFDKLHSGLVKKHGGYVACADFSRGGKKYDVDFVVKIDKGGQAKVVKEAIHKVNGEKRKGHLD